MGVGGGGGGANSSIRITSGYRVSTKSFVMDVQQNPKFSHIHCLGILTKIGRFPSNSYTICYKGCQW